MRSLSPSRPVTDYIWLQPLLYLPLDIKKADTTSVTPFSSSIMASNWRQQQTFPWCSGVCNQNNTLLSFRKLFLKCSCGPEDDASWQTGFLWTRSSVVAETTALSSTIARTKHVQSGRTFLKTNTFRNIVVIVTTVRPHSHVACSWPKKILRQQWNRPRTFHYMSKVSEANCQPAVQVTCSTRALHLLLQRNMLSKKEKQ